MKTCSNVSTPQFEWQFLIALFLQIDYKKKMNFERNLGFSFAEE